MAITGRFEYRVGRLVCIVHTWIDDTGRIRAAADIQEDDDADV